VGVKGGRQGAAGGDKPLRIVKAEDLEDDDDVGSSAFEDDDEDEDEEEDDSDLSLGQDESDDEEEEEGGGKPKKKEAIIPKAVRDKLAQDDAEIAELERKLGLKGRKSLPKSFHEEGLGEILEVLGDGAADEETQLKKKRKAEADEWLAQKRQKAAAAAAQTSSQKVPDSRVSRGAEKPLRIIKAEDLEEDDDVGSSAFEDDDDEDSLLDGLEGDSQDDEDEDMEEFDEDGSADGSEPEGDDKEDDAFSGFDSDGAESEPSVPRVRENPYVAPTTGPQVAKYVPPSRRQETGSDAELTQRIRRQLQGLVNRITDSNLVGIVGDIEKVYREQPRQHVTTILVDLILVQVCDPASLPDTLLILSAGFATALYRVMGMDFGAQLIQETVERFDQYYERCLAAPAEGAKQTSNLITLMAEMYNFQLIGCNLIFDYIRFLLNDLTELNAELLLRIIRLAGPSLRQDDPLALKDIVSMIRPAVAKIGEANLSVRTKFMIETINDLKNNKMRTGVSASAVLSEHGTRMKKLLGTLNSRKLKATEPLRIGLRDIKEADKRGKWWLVGASWAGRTDEQDGHGDMKGQKNIKQDDSDEDMDLDGEDGGAPDLAELAREQQMNTDVRRSIFVAILSATDYEDAYLRLLKLRLNKDRQREMPNVLIQCAGAEAQYNPYYTLIAKRICSDRKVRWSLQDALWKLFRRLGESIFGDDADEEEDEDDKVDMRRLVNVAKMYGALVADGALGLAVLKCLNLPYLQAKTRAFVEVLVITAFMESYKQGKGEDGSRAVVERIMKSVADTPELSRGMLWFLKKVIRKSDLAGGKEEGKKLKKACAIAVDVLEIARVQGVVEAPIEAPTQESDEDEEDDDDL
jgi:nucleolar MIF4G domain-containing protein 1